MVMCQAEPEQHSMISTVWQVGSKVTMYSHLNLYI